MFVCGGTFSFIRICSKSKGWMWCGPCSASCRYSLFANTEKDCLRISRMYPVTRFASFYAMRHRIMRKIAEREIFWNYFDYVTIIPCHAMVKWMLDIFVHSPFLHSFHHSFYLFTSFSTCSLSSWLSLSKSCLQFKCKTLIDVTSSIEVNDNTAHTKKRESNYCYLAMKSKRMKKIHTKMNESSDLHDST